MEIELVCPLGSDCEKAVDGKVQRCIWYVKLVGKDPQSQKEIDEWSCAMSWMPLLLIETAQTNRGQTAALESFRNEVVKGNGSLANMLLAKKGAEDDG